MTTIPAHEQRLAERALTRQRLAELYARGFSTVEISRETGIPTSTVRTLLQEAGVQMRPRGRRPLS